MPIATVKLPDGQIWYVSTRNEVIIPIHDAMHMTATEIGEQVQALMPRLRRIQQYQPSWAPCDDIDDLEAWIERKERQKELQGQIQAQNDAKRGQTRQEIQAKYERIFLRIARRDGFRCRQCGRGDGLEIDHIIPVSKGGTNALENLQLLCETCNSEKRDRVAESFIE